MLGSYEIMMNVVHQAQVHRATAHGEHLYDARLATHRKDRTVAPVSNAWKPWSGLGASRKEKPA